MNKKTASRIIIGTLVVVALFFVGFYFFFIRQSDTSTGGLTITDTTSNPIYPTSDSETSNSGVFPNEPIPGRGDIRDTETEGGSGGTTQPPTISGGGVINNIPITSIGSVFRISEKPVSGATSFITEMVPTVRYLERERGNIYDYRIGSTQLKRISIETIPRIQEAFFSNNGLSLIARYLDRDGSTIQTYHAKLVTNKSTSSPGMVSLEGIFLPRNISDFSISPNGTSAFYLVPNQAGSIGYLFSPSTRVSTPIFESPAQEWISHWSNDRIVHVSSRPSVNVVGYSYSIETRNKVTTPFLPSLQGAITLGSPDQKTVLLLEGGTSLFSTVVDRATLLKRGLSVRTIPEKCAWDPTDSNIFICGVPVNPPEVLLPESWYMGTVSYSDEIWRFDTRNNTSERIASINQFTLGPVNVYRPFLTPDGKYFIFTNKKDLSLWGTRVGE